MRHSIRWKAGCHHKQMEIKQDITSFIPVSPGRIGLKRLSKMLNVDDRTVKKMILTARLNGEIIASCETGYFIPSTVEELETFYRTQRKRALTTLTSLKAVRAKLKAVKGEGGIVSETEEE